MLQFNKFKSCICVFVFSLLVVWCVPVYVSAQPTTVDIPLTQNVMGGDEVGATYKVSRVDCKTLELIGDMGDVNGDRTYSFIGNISSSITFNMSGFLEGTYCYQIEQTSVSDDTYKLSEYLDRKSVV